MFATPSRAAPQGVRPEVGSGPACPNCRSPIGAEDVVCNTCGADIALMTLAADRAILEHALGSQDSPQPVSTEQLAPRLGDYLLRHGYITPDQLQAALMQQALAPAGERRPRLGETLVDMGAVSRDRLDRAIAEQILELQTALVEANRSLERRVAERTGELQAALARLSEFNQLKAHFVANVSHELRTPLTHVKGYNVLLAEGGLGPLTGEQREALKISAAAISQLEQLINDLISYAAAARGELALNLRPVSVQTVIRQVVEKSRGKADKRKVSLTPQLPPDLPLVTADEEKLYWTVLQLVDNGLKFTPEGGHVVVGALAQAQRVVIAVRDTGIGIPPDRLKEIFEPFRQLDGSSTRRYSGTGLGLALAQRIVEAHGTLMTVESREGRGSVFSFALPQSASA